MPTLTQKRIWCKTCNEFQVHEKEELLGKVYICSECKTKYSSIKLSKIPEEKLVEQRERYRVQQRNSMNNIFGMYMLYGLHSFDRVGTESNIQESDAGQIEIEKQLKREYEELREKRVIQHEKDLKLKKEFHKLGRNETCLCGSGKKYKKCCWSKINRIV